MAEEHLVLDKLASGDRPAICAAGLIAAEALKKYGMAVFMIDVLGRVHIVPNAAIQVLKKPRLSEDELNLLDETEAINLLLKQGDSEDEVVAYLHRRTTHDVKEAL
jgi:hypothetical protein